MPTPTKLRSSVTGLLIAATMSLAAGVALAHSGATGVVKERMEAMTEIGEQMKLIGVMVRGDATFDSGTIVTAANEIATLSAHIETLFPDDSANGPSEASDNIWNDWGRFVEMSEELESAAGDLAKAALTGERQNIAATFMATGRTCSACHETFRD